MLRIDCLLLNTDVADTVRRIVGYLGHEWLSEGKDVSFRSIYKELRKNGVEIDLETAAHIYADELPLHDYRFTKEEDIKYATGKWFDDIVRAITLQKPKQGEKEIGELSPSQAVVKGIADAFANNVRDDETTRSILKTLEDAYRNGATKLLGEKPNPEVGKDNRTTSEIIQDALDKEAIGYRNQKDGTINSLATMHDEVRRQIGELTQEMEAHGDHDKAEQWKAYAKSLEDASYTLLFNSREGKKILNDALMDNGFVRTSRDGKQAIDWRKLAGNINSYEQLRENVVKSLEDQGFPEDIGHRVADALSKEFRDMRGKILETAMRKQTQVADSWADSAQKQKETLPEIIDKRVKEWQNLTKFEGKENEPLIFNKQDAKRIIGDALKESEQYGMPWGEGKHAIDWVKMSQEPPEQSALNKMVQDRLEAQGIDPETARHAAESVSRDYHGVLTADIQSNAQRILDNRTALLDREQKMSKSRLTRLAELHDLGIFDGAHDKLLAHVLGIEEHDRQAMDDVREFAQQMSKLRQLMNGNDFLVPSMQREVAHQIQQIIARNVENKTRMLKIMSSLNKVYQLENSSLVSGYRNLLENHLSGLQEYATTKANVKMKLGKELAGNHKELRQLMGDTWKSIAKGGNEFGLAPYQVGGNQLRVSDIYNLNKMKDADWKNPKDIAKGVASAILTVPRAFLSGTDGMFKTGLYRLHFLSGMHDALMKTGKYNHNEAVEVLNDAFYGKGQLEKARIKAKELYDKTGIHHVSKKEINITANELLHENLLQQEEVTPEMIHEVQQSAFKMAGLGMGHESNNPISKVMQSSKKHFNQVEQEAFSKGQYGKAASARMWNTMVNSVALRFAASQANWAWLKVEQSGVGLISGMVHYQMGKSIKGKELLDPKRQQEQTEHYLKARQSAARGLLGLAVNALLTGVAIPQIAKVMYGDDEDAVDELFTNMEGNYLEKAIFLKLAPIWGLADYYKHTTHSGVPELAVPASIIGNVTGFGTHNNATQFADALHYWSSPKEKNNTIGSAKAGQLLANNLPHVPFYRTGRDVLQTADYFRTGKQPMYHYPQNFLQGLMGGGVIEDVSTLIPQDKQPEWMEEWNDK